MDGYLGYNITMTFYAYIYRDPSRGEPIYVGKGKGKRAYAHLSRTDNHPLTRRIQHMRQNGTEPQVEIIEALNEDHSFFLESCLIEMFGRKDQELGPLLNLTDGGEGTSGAVRSIETRIKMSIAKQNMSSETRAKMSLSRIGKIRTPEHQSKLSDALRGRSFSSETRARMSASQKARTDRKGVKGRVISPETRLKMSESAKKRWSRQ